MQLGPQDTVEGEELAHAQRLLVRDSAWATVCGALFGGVVLAGYAVQVGAGPFEIGLLAAIPYLAQMLQLPAMVFVDQLLEDVTRLV